MRPAGILLSGLLAAAGVWAGSGPESSAAPPGGGGSPRFKTQEIDTALSIGYAVLTADINGDKKPDIVVVDQLKVVWYENPTWKKRVILDGKTKPDNVCAAAVDVDGDGQLDLVLGAGWRPFDTANPGTLQWLKRGKTLDEEWTLHPIPCDEPTVHRVRVADVDGDGKPEIVLAPLMGRDSTAKGNWLDGRPVRITAYKVPAKPEKPESWKPTVISDELHVVHNLATYRVGERENLVTASYGGVHFLLREDNGGNFLRRIGEGNQANPTGNRGASEVKMGRLRRAPVVDLPVLVVGTVEPWHGNQVVVYTSAATTPKDPKEHLWDRHVVDDQLRWGHAVWFADLDGDGTDELVIGVRDDPNPKLGDKHTDRRGVRVYKSTDGKGAKWERTLLDEGGVAVEDLTVTDLDGDGKPDIIACGRQTKNVRIYWNQGK